MNISTQIIEYNARKVVLEGRNDDPLGIEIALQVLLDECNYTKEMLEKLLDEQY